MFELVTPGEIVFGAGTARSLAERAARFGRRVFTVIGRGARQAELLDRLRAEGLAVETCALGHEPTIGDAREAARQARAHRTDVVLAAGGGSVIDLGKATSALLTNPGDPLDYLEVIGRGRRISERAAPFVAVPTSAGAGAEVTRNAVLAAPEEGLKASLRSPLMIPRIALVDPELTLSLPGPITASTGMDALTQLIEPYVSARANPLTDPLCLAGMERVARSLRRAVLDGADVDARTDMSLAALFGGIALANAGLGAVHGFAAPIGGRFDAPHGAVCAALLPEVIRANVRALESRAPGGPALQRYRTVARTLTGDPAAGPSDAVAWVEALRAALGIPRLGTYGIGAGDLDALADAAMQASSMKANPIPLERAELVEILHRAL